MMAVVVLCFRGLERHDWCLSALLVLDGDGPPPALELADGGHPITACHLASRLGRSLWRYDFRVPLSATERTVDYRIGGGPPWRIRLPAQGGPLRIAFTACNGFEDERTGSAGPGRNRLWRKLEAEHARAPFHLLLHGGDQLYADSVWHEVPALAAWRRLPARRRLAAPFTPEVAEAVADYYFGRYCWLWEQPELARIMPAIPSLMMWDDHDIFDGWGSHDPEWEDCPVFRGIYAAAREHFALFQLAARQDQLPQGFSDPGGAQFGWSYRLLHGIGIIAPDLRSERSLERVMGDAGWRAFVRMLEGLTDCRHVLLLSSVPLLNAHEGFLERLYEALPGQQYFQLDMRDQWRSIFHRDEWLRLLRHLFDFSARTGARITAFSGEIHLGAFAVAQHAGTKIYQLTSSGIVHPPPPAPLVAFLDWMSTGPAEEVEPGLKLDVLKIPGYGKRFLGERNWLALELSGANPGLGATWHTADKSFPFQRERS